MKVNLKSFMHRVITQILAVIFLLQAVGLTSIKTQLPFEYYALPFCKPSGGVKYRVENLGKFATCYFC